MLLLRQPPRRAMLRRPGRLRPFTSALRWCCAPTRSSASRPNAWLRNWRTRWAGRCAMAASMAAFNERALLHGRDCRAWLADHVIEDSDAFKRHQARSTRRGARHRALELPLHDRDQHRRPALIAGNTVVLKHATRRCWWANAWPSAFHAAGVPEGVFQNLFLDHQGTESPDRRRAASISSTSPARSVAAGDRTRGRRHLHRHGARARRQGSGLRDGRCRSRLGVDVLMDGAMFNSGQCCCGIERLYVARERCMTPSSRRPSPGSRPTELGNPLDRNHARADGQCALRRGSPRADREALRGAHGPDRSGTVPRRRWRRLS
jgi:hypothetical protein